MKIYVSSFKSRIGKVYLAFTDKGLCKISISDKNEFFGWIRKKFKNAKLVEASNKAKGVENQLKLYFNGKLKSFDVKLDLRGTGFQKLVWLKAMKIPYGSVVSYKKLAEALGTKGFRAVGRALSENPVPIIVPCHRVVTSNGKLGGYSAGIKIKKFLLKIEGVKM